MMNYKLTWLSPLLCCALACGAGASDDQPAADTGGSPETSPTTTGGGGTGGAVRATTSNPSRTGSSGSSTVAVGGSGGSGGTGGSPTGGTAPVLGAGGAGLRSSVFEPLEGYSSGGQGGAVVKCEPSTVSGCDWSRLDGCCSQWACNKVTRLDVFDTYPITSCESLVKCVKAHPGCSTADDPLCFQNEAASAPCLNEGYLASFKDESGPFAWTKHLVACACGLE